MDRTCRIFLLCLLASGCDETEERERALVPAVAPVMPDTPVVDSAAADPDQFAIDTVVTGLEVAWAIDFAPDGRIFLTERTGRIGAAGTLRPIVDRQCDRLPARYSSRAR